MKTMKWVNTIAFLAMVAINLLAELLPLGGYTTGQISDAYPNLFTPAGLTFAIWSIIYLLVGFFVLYQWGLFGSSEEGSRMTAKIGILFTLSCVLNILWILCWHSNSIGWSVMCMAGLLITLVLIQFRIRSDIAGKAQRFAVNAGFDIYYGWIIAAAIANISVWLVKLGWDRFGLSETFWAASIILVGAAVGICVVLIGRNRLAGLAMTWAYGGILMKHLSAAGHAGKYPIIISVVILGIAGILASILLVSVCAPMRAWEEKL
ncbi:MAG: tryptophan-rich sensory protein [Oscillospiraceae bacterium]|nr:tryptophan-rich sensory protein [Oscillospiraceae bacterium]